MTTQLPLSRVVAQHIRHRRSLAGMTQRDVCRSTGITQKWLSKIETGKGQVSLDDLERIANALDVSVLTLVSADS